MLFASALTLESGAPSDAFEVLVGARGELSVVLLDIRSASRNRAALSREAVGVIRDAVLAGAPIYDIVSTIRSWTAAERDRSVAIALLRFSQPDSRVEILNAGMPAVACALPGGRLSLHSALSLPIGESFGEVHPYELSPLVWGSAWFLMSGGVTAGSLDPDTVRNSVVAHELHQSGAELAAGPPASLSPWIERLAGATVPERDASLVVVHADPSRRFESGIRP